MRTKENLKSGEMTILGRKIIYKRWKSNVENRIIINFSR